MPRVVLCVVLLAACALAAPLRGVDVSHYQGHIDWHAAKASGLSFAMTKVRPLSRGG